MNKLRNIPAIIIIILTIMCGCKKSTDTATKPVFTKGITYKFADKVFISDSVSIAHSPWSSDIYYWSTSSNSGSFAQISFQLTRMAVGEYNINYANYASVFYQSTPHNVSHGKLIITDSGATIKGTFSFTCNDSMKITDGAFNVQY